MVDIKCIGTARGGYGAVTPSYEPTLLGVHRCTTSMYRISLLHHTIYLQILDIKISYI